MCVRTQAHMRCVPMPQAGHAHVCASNAIHVRLHKLKLHARTAARISSFQSIGLSQAHSMLYTSTSMAYLVANAIES